MRENFNTSVFVFQTPIRKPSDDSRSFIPLPRYPRSEFSPSDSDSLKPRHGRAPKSLPGGRSLYDRDPRGGLKPRPHSVQNDKVLMQQELFDRTLERMTNGGPGGGSILARRVKPGRKGASLSTRSSLIYSETPEMSDTQDLSSDSDVSLPRSPR